MVIDLLRTLGVGFIFKGLQFAFILNTLKNQLIQAVELGTCEKRFQLYLYPFLP